MAKQATLLDLESMQDDTLDHVQEAPDFIQPPAGDYKIVTKGGKITKFENDDGTETQSIQVTLAVVETLELVSNDEPPVPDGSLFTIRFQGTIDGLAMFKREVRKMADVEDLAGATLGSIFDMLAEELEFYGRVSYSSYKGRDGERRQSLKLRVIPTPVE
jgi:hypothetical protein